jgi:ATP-dependent helicase/nuclease subunit A
MMLNDEIERSRIRNSIAEDIFVEAAAGTGKTSELIHRIISIITKTDTQINEIVAITFTEAAAAELKHRLYDELNRIANDESKQNNKAYRASRAIASWSKCNISTIHSFARQIIDQNCELSGIPPRFQVLEETEFTLEIFKDTDELFKQLYKSDIHQKALLRLQAFDFSETHMRDLYSIFCDNMDNFIGLDAIGELCAIPYEAIIDKISNIYMRSEHCVDENDELFALLIKLQPLKDQLQQAANKFDDYSFLRLLSSIDLKLNVGQKLNWNIDLQAFRTEIKEFRTEIEDLKSAIVNNSLVLIAGFLINFGRQKALERKARGQLSFHDLLLNCVSLLNSAENLRSNYSYIFVDEFQDTDPLQIQIVELLRDKFSSSKNKARIFYVGDPMQSIYAFRRADLNIYRETRSKFPEGLVRLISNFRSHPLIINWINRLFKEIRNDKLEFNAISAAAVSNDNNTRVFYFMTESNDNADSRRIAEARQVAQLIKSKLMKHRSLSDIAILTPNRNNLLYLEKELGDANIAYQIEISTLIYSTPAISTFINLLAAINNPTDELDIVATLRSPIFGCSDKELNDFLSKNGTWNYELFKSADNNYVINCLQKLKKYHEEARWYPVDEIMKKVIDDFNLFEVLSTKTNYRDVLRRLTYVCSQASQFAEDLGISFDGYVKIIKSIQSQELRTTESIASDQDINAVRILTIHHAKGLEFPVVILTGTDKSLSDRSKILFQNVNNQPSIYLNKTLKTRIQPAKDPDFEIAESLRLLYVALTRAKDELYISLNDTTGSWSSVITENIDKFGDCWQQWLPKTKSVTSSSNAIHNDIIKFDQEQYNKMVNQRTKLLGSYKRISKYTPTDLANALYEVDLRMLSEAKEAKIPDKDTITGADLGLAVHGILQYFSASNADKLPALCRYFSELNNVDYNKLFSIIQNAISDPTLSQLLDIQRVYKEVEFIDINEDYILEGKIDLLIAKNNTYDIYDFKSNFIANPDYLEELTKHYAYQMAAYQLLIKTQFQTNEVSSKLVFLNPELKIISLGDLSEQEIKIKHYIFSNSSKDLTA